MFQATFWVATALWLIAVTPLRVSAEPMQGVGVTEPAQASPPSVGEPLGLPPYHDPPNPLLADGGLTSQIYTALGTVLGLLALAVYLYKRLSRRSVSGSPTDGTIRILSRTYLGPKESLCLVQVGTQVLLLGQTSAGISLLHRLDTPSTESSARASDGKAGRQQFEEAEDRDALDALQGSSIELVSLKSRLKRLNTKWGLGA